MDELDLGEMMKFQKEFKEFIEEIPCRTEIDKIVKDIVEKQNSSIAMEFTQKIGQMLRENGVVPQITKYKTEAECTENSVKQRYGVKFDRLDFTEHDKPFITNIEQLKYELKEAEKKIEELESELSVKENLLKIKNGLYGEKPRIHIIGLKEFGGEQYVRYSDVEYLIKELES